MKWTGRELAWFAATCFLGVWAITAFFAAHKSDLHAESAYAHSTWALSIVREANARLRGRNEALTAVMTELYDTGRLECTVTKNEYAGISIGGSPDPNAPQPHDITISNIVAAVDCPQAGTVRMTFCENKEAP